MCNEVLGVIALDCPRMQSTSAPEGNMSVPRSQTAQQLRGQRMPALTW